MNVSVCVCSTAHAHGDVCTHYWPVDTLSGVEEWSDMLAVPKWRAKLRLLSASGLMQAFGVVFKQMNYFIPFNRSVKHQTVCSIQTKAVG